MKYRGSGLRKHDQVVLYENIFFNKKSKYPSISNITKHSEFLQSSKYALELSLCLNQIVFIKNINKIHVCAPSLTMGQNKKTGGNQLKRSGK